MARPEDKLVVDTLHRHHAKWKAMMPPKPVKPEMTLAEIQYNAGIQHALEIIGQQICKI